MARKTEAPAVAAEEPKVKQNYGFGVSRVDEEVKPHQPACPDPESCCGGFGREPVAIGDVIAEMEMPAEPAADEAVSELGDQFVEEMGEPVEPPSSEA